MCVRFGTLRRIGHVPQIQFENDGYGAYISN